MRQLQEAGFNRVVPNVWSRAPPSIAAVSHLWSLRSRTAGIDPICTLAAEGRRRSIKVMPWFEYGLMEPADAAVVRDNPSWVLAKANGQRWMTMHGNHRMAWLNPASRSSSPFRRVGGGDLEALSDGWSPTGRSLRLAGSVRL